MAYAVQKSFVEACLDSETIGGFKAALTAPAAQQAFGMAMPITGVLFSNGAQTSGATVDVTNFRTLMLGTELGVSPWGNNHRPVGIGCRAS